MSRVASISVARLLLASLALLMLWPDAAAAENCLDQVRQLADEKGIATAPPKASPDQEAPTAPPGSKSEQLGRSGGVIAPPPTDDRSVIAPPPSADTRMPTLPDVTPADRTSLQALLVAARAEAERGREGACLERLAKAKELAQRQTK